MVSSGVSPFDVVNLPQRQVDSVEFLLQFQEKKFQSVVISFNFSKVAEDHSKQLNQQRIFIKNLVNFAFFGQQCNSASTTTEKHILLNSKIFQCQFLRIKHCLAGSELNIFNPGCTGQVEGRESPPRPTPTAHREKLKMQQTARQWGCYA